MKKKRPAKRKLSCECGVVIGGARLRGKYGVPNEAWFFFLFFLRATSANAAAQFPWQLFQKFFGSYELKLIARGKHQRGWWLASWDIWLRNCGGGAVLIWS
jgi:hypothetical protein